MAVMPLDAKRYKVEDRIDSLRFTLPRQRSIATAGFLAFWLTFWALGEMAALGALLYTVWNALQGRPPWMSGGGDYCAGVFLLVWLTGWTFGGYAAFKSLLHSLGGKEIVEVDGASVRIRRTVLGIGPASVYDADYVDRLRVDAEAAANQQEPQGLLVFDYVGKTISFGGSLKEGEAKEIVALIGERFPHLTKAVTDG